MNYIIYLMLKLKDKTLDVDFYAPLLVFSFKQWRLVSKVFLPYSAEELMKLKYWQMPL